MKRIAIAIAFGLLAGWIFSSIFLKDPATAENKDAGASGKPILPRIGATSSSIRVRFEDDWKPEARDGKTYSPFRDDLKISGRVNDLTLDELIAAIREGVFPDSSELYSAFQRIAEMDPVLAMELRDELHSRTDRDAARSAIISVCVKIDANGLFEHLRSQARTSERAHFTWSFASAWMKENPEAALAKLSEIREMSGVFGKRVVEGMLRTWAETDYAAAERWIAEEADSDEREELANSLLAGYTRTLQGEEAVEFVLQRHDNPSLQNLLTEGFQSWAMSDPEAAIRRFAGMPEGHAVLREAESLGRAALMSLYMFEKDTSEILTYQELLPEGEVRRQFLLGAANNASSNDIPAAQLFIEHIPESDERIQAMRSLTDLWMRRDPVAVSEWLSALDPSPSRDSTVGSFAMLLAKSDLPRAQEWANTISDEGERERILGMLPRQQ